MRVVAGKYRGIVLSEFKGDEVRPTADRVKENLFNIIGSKIVGKSFLDLFCGTGGMGIEALSRGTSEVIFVDKSKDSASLTEKNLAKIKEDNKVILSDGLSFLTRTNKKFDFIFIDPPYASDLGINALKIIADRDLLTENGVAIFEHEEKFDSKISKLELFDERKYGRVYLSFLRKRQEKKCIYAGTFDPITTGHVAIINKALERYDKVIVGILVNPDKKPTASKEQRKSLIEKVFEKDDRVLVESHDGYLVDFAKKHNATDYVRGIRNQSDFIYEEKIRILNEQLDPNIKTIYINSPSGNENLSSSKVRELIKDGKDVKGLIPDCILEELVKIYQK